MIRRIIQTLGAIAVVAVIVFTVIGRDTYVSAIEWKRVKAVAAAADKKNPGQRRTVAGGESCSVRVRGREYS